MPQFQSTFQSHKRMASVVLIVGTGLVANACEPPNPCLGGVTPPSQTSTTEEVCEEAALYEASATVGYGTAEFRTFDGEVVLHVEHGPQGGQHIYGAVLVTGMNPGERAFSEPRGCEGVEIYDPISVAYTLSFPEDRYPSITCYGTPWVEEGTPQESTSRSIRMVMSIWEVVATYPDEDEITLTAHAVVTDACGTTVEASDAFALSLDE